MSSTPGPLARAAHAAGHSLSRPRAIPYLIVGATFLLLSLGLIMVWSASAILGIQNTGSSLSVVSKQGMFAVLGVLALVLVSRLPMLTLRAGQAMWLARFPEARAAVQR